MAVDDGRLLPLASVLLYGPGQGDPVVQDHGDGSFYDVLERTYRWGLFELDSSGLPLLEWVKDIGLCCRPYLVGQHTRLANFTTSGGAWEEVQPATGSPRWYRLSQYNTAANVVWSAAGSFSLPSNPDFCFSLIVPDSPPDNNASLYPPWVQLQFGNGQWAIQYAKGGGAQLLAWNATWNGVTIPGWTVVLELPELQHVANQDNSEAFVWIRCLRGKLAISTDMGRTYALFAWGDPTIPVVVEQGPVVFSGQGGAALFGLHQLLYYEGDYTAPQWNTFTARSSPSPMIGAGPNPTTYTPPDGTAITFTDNSDSEDGIAGYIATLTPAEDTTTSPPGWNVWHTPELFAVWYEFPILLQPWSGGLTWSNPFDGSIRALDIDKPIERGDSNCKFSVRLNAGEQFTFLYGRWPKVQVLLGQTNENGTQSFLVAFTGYLRDPQTEWSEYNTLTFSVTADGPAIRFKRTKWGRTFRPPLSNWTVNQAIMYVFYTEGLGEYPTTDNSSTDSSSSYYTGYPTGDAVFLFAGQPESPFEWPALGEDKWSTLQRLAGWAGLEMIPLDDGTFISLPKNFVQPYVSDIWEASPPENLLELVEKAHYGYDSGETVTAGIVGATDQWGRQIIFWIVDVIAETDPLSGRFCPWREIWEEDVPGTANPLVIAARVQALATDKLLMKQEALIHAPVALGVSRGDAAQVYNTPTGINNTDVLTVMTLHHHYVFDPSFETLFTDAGLRRIL